MRETHALRAAIWEAPLISSPLRLISRRLRSEILWATAITEAEEIIFGNIETHDLSLLHYPSDDGVSLGPFQLTPLAMQDAMDEWDGHSRAGEPRPTMDTYLGQCLYALWYWERWEPKLDGDGETIDPDEGIDYTIWIPSLHNHGPDWASEDCSAYLKRWQKVWGSPKLMRPLWEW